MSDLPRSWLEENQWLQGCFVCPEDMPFFYQKFPYLSKDNQVYLITASQSCDVCGLINKEPIIEFSVARKIEVSDSRLLHNKNPRLLHLIAEEQQGSVQQDAYFELQAYEKIAVNKSELQDYKEIIPYEKLSLTQSTIQEYANWLAARYNRPALPNAFERRLSEAWKKDKQAKAATTANAFITGIYIDLDTYEEISDDKAYTVDLLFLITEEGQPDGVILKEIEELQATYLEKIQKAGFFIRKSKIATEDKVSLKTFRTYRRLAHLDFLSYKEDEIKPIEIINDF